MSNRDCDAVTLTAPQIARHIGVKYHLVYQWTARGYLRPIGKCEGSGSVRRYHERELHVAVLIVRLIDAGFTAWAAAGLAREIMDSWGTLAPDAMSVIGDGVTLIVSDPVSRAVETLPSL